jgi:conjugal transfer pilin signal peptidase TrbI
MTTETSQLPQETPVKERLSLPEYLRLVKASFKKHWYYYLAPIVVAVGFNHYAMIGVNVTDSLKDHLFITIKGNFMPERGDKMAYRWHGGGGYPEGSIFVKIVRGVPGDTVTREGRDFFVNGSYVGTAKEISKTGKPLEAGPVGVIPPGHYYVATTHPDSLDSRYAITGWIKEDAIKGKVFGLF